ncbi:RdgB/HAM1 family non-canonical purine NTP pyrophosphatase [Desulfovibrio sp.]|uniref:RdgB/HAM1 family non-canonical purine NTP pyrophosphatase n=1 Tax=Desulfovibrio sp. TaxID=885 RepID=UPI0023CF4478|nr:RdgB/HAM1 family non-canonical purine NTP pyrophosphatase [Desulfovibrio sp.]MDE7242146.1 RdgB/HAM1 family non-canonical purine NTP pyrophosphatase [Desulfovibrio sp.]
MDAQTEAKAAHGRPRVVLATRNAGKIAELAGPLSAFGVELVGLDAFPEIGEIEENGVTFEENALIKARAVAKTTGLTAIADDSGLMVDALGGAPGVYSARYADDWEMLPGENRDGRNIRKLLDALKNVPEGERACRFVTVMAAVRPDGRELAVRGEWPGTLLQSPRGSNGFGYAPVFFDADIGRTAAELTREEKTARSHRGRAAAALLERWRDFMGA